MVEGEQTKRMKGGEEERRKRRKEREGEREREITGCTWLGEGLQEVQQRWREIKAREKEERKKKHSL